MIGSRSVENLSTEQSKNDGSSMCLELAIEGERLCKAGDCRAGVAFFQAAIASGTEDLRTLSAIYSQLGNAYFYLGDYSKSMEYHKHDLTLARTIGDKLGEAKSSGNLGNALKVMGRFDEAVVCCRRQLEIARELNDKISEGRALYNIANVYHAKGKHVGRLEDMEPGVIPEEVKICLEQAVKYYEDNLSLMESLGDVAAQGRACGNLGNTNYLLGKFQKAIFYHKERLKIALQFNDKAAERRANSNLGNSHIFIGEFANAAEYYKRTLALAQELDDSAIEGQSCYSLGNTYTLLHDYINAIIYHQKHYDIAVKLEDRVGEGRACWSLGNAYSAIENYEQALFYAKQHLEISLELNDTAGQASAYVNINDLEKALGLPVSSFSQNGMFSAPVDTDEVNCDQLSPGVRRFRINRKSMENLNIIKLTPDKKHLNIEINNSALQIPSKSCISLDKKEEGVSSSYEVEDEGAFFDFLSRFQSKRMDDQRCSLSRSAADRKCRIKSNITKQMSESIITKKKHHSPPKPPANSGPEDLLDFILDMQSGRMDEQRVRLPYLPGLSTPIKTKDNATSIEKDNNLECKPLPNAVTENRKTVKKCSTVVPDEDFFSLIMRLQSGRMDDQRAMLNQQE